MGMDKNATRKRQIYVPVAAILHKAARDGLCNWIRLTHPKVKPAGTKAATPEYVQALLPHCGDKLERLVLFLVYTGAWLASTHHI